MNDPHDRYRAYEVDTDGTCRLIATFIEEQDGRNYLLGRSGTVLVYGVAVVANGLVPQEDASDEEDVKYELNDLRRQVLDLEEQNEKLESDLESATLRIKDLEQMYKEETARGISGG